jgi:hypothetical protein
MLVWDVCALSVVSPVGCCEWTSSSVMGIGNAVAVKGTIREKISIMG